MGGEEGGEEDDGLAYVKALCDRALDEYADVPIFETLLQVVTGVFPCADGEISDEDEESDGEVDNPENARALFERALVGAGLHFSLGGRLWRMYRALERKVSGNESPAVDMIYRRQLALPLRGNDRVLEAVRRRLGSRPGGSSALAEMRALHESALKLRIKCESHEVVVASAAAALGEASELAEREQRQGTLENGWQAYASWLASSNEIPLALSVFERAVAACGRLGPALWIGFYEFGAVQLKDHALALRVAHRGSRHHPH